MIERPRPRAALALLAVTLAFGFVASGCVLGRGLSDLFSSTRKLERRTRKPFRNDARLAVLWVGHATALVQIDDKLILTDPVFTSTVGQLSRRLVEPGIAAEDVPPVDAVLISHVHFDHLSLGSLDMLERRVRMLLVPRGGTAYLTDFGFPVIELRPWQPWEKAGLRITAVPVSHVGFRYGADAAWAHETYTGYVIEYHGIKVYFGGDTAYDQRNFVLAGQRFGDIDLALLPIAPIEPRSFMRRTHMDPDEAIQAFFDLGAKRMVPIHFDTFTNSMDKPGDARRLLAAAQRRYPLDGRVVAPLAIGEQRVFLQKGEDPGAFKIQAPAPIPRPLPRPAPPPSDDDDRLD